MIKILLLLTLLIIKTIKIKILFLILSVLLVSTPVYAGKNDVHKELMHKIEKSCKDIHPYVWNFLKRRTCIKKQIHQIFNCGRSKI